MLDIVLMGNFEWRWLDRPILSEPSRGVRLLLATLACAPDRPLERAALADTLWPDSSGDQARTNLRKTLHQLKSAVPDADEVFQWDRSAVGIRNPDKWRVDVQEFLRHLRLGTPQSLLRALEWYPSDLLPRDHADWLVVERQHLRNLRSTAVEQILDHFIKGSAWTQAAPIARDAVAIDPFRESLWGRYFEILGQLRDIPALESAYRRMRTRIWREFSTNPSHETVQSYVAALETARSPKPSAIRSAATGLPRWPIALFRRPDDFHAFQEWLATDLPVFNLYGPGGTGKSTLFEGFLVNCGNHRQTVMVDCHHIVPTPRGFLSALPIEDRAEPWKWLLKAQPDWLIFVDGLENAGALADFFRRDWLPRLFRSVRLVIAGRRALTDYWPLDTPWRSLVWDRAVTGWNAEEAEAYLHRRGMVEPEIARQLLAFCGGNPMALRLAVDWIQHPSHRGLSFERHWVQMVAQLVPYMLRDISSPQLKLLAEGCSVIPRINEEILGQFVQVLLLPPRRTRLFFERLETFSALEPCERGLTWNEDIRRFLRADLTRRFPALHRQLERAALDWHRLHPEASVTG